MYDHRKVIIKPLLHLRVSTEMLAADNHYSRSQTQNQRVKWRAAAAAERREFQVARPRSPFLWRQRRSVRKCGARTRSLGQLISSPALISAQAKAVWLAIKQAVPAATIFDF